jgi:hypothetical protein
MGSIYAAAQITIIACADIDTSYGLPSVSKERKAADTVIHIGAHTLMLESNDSRVDILNSTWASRAWIYQEDYLSKHRLFFTERQVVYIAGEPIKYEVRSPVRRGGYGSLAHMLPPLNPHAGLSCATWLISEYSRRHLSYEMDALNAIVGALNTLDRLQRSARHVFGLPFTCLDHWMMFSSGLAESAKFRRFSNVERWFDVLVAITWSQFYDARGFQAGLLWVGRNAFLWKTMARASQLAARSES